MKTKEYDSAAGGKRKAHLRTVEGTNSGEEWSRRNRYVTDESLTTSHHETLSPRMLPKIFPNISAPPSTRLLTPAEYDNTQHPMRAASSEVGSLWGAAVAQILPLSKARYNTLIDWASKKWTS
jgi:hypothetical protein